MITRCYSKNITRSVLVVCIAALSITAIVLLLIGIVAPSWWTLHVIKDGQVSHT